MSGFDDPGIFYSDSFGGDAQADEGQPLQRRFKEFLRQYRVGTDRTGFTFKYSDPPASVSQVAGITGVSHRARPALCILCIPGVNFWVSHLLSGPPATS
uniref:MCM N-terminal domain-containing protein n=1 Tax=Nomascus leucogenys TaxID=61853 RepID=A0A2I3HZK2_NOMLE